MVNRRPRSKGDFFGAFVVLVLLAIALVLPPPPQQVLRSGDPDPRAVKGALHVHTNRSDGGGTVDDVAAAAARAGLSFVIITDHGDGRGLQAPAYRSGVLCVDGAEITTADGHVVAVGIRPPEYRLGGEARDVIDDIHRLGGIAIAAHPVSAKPELAWRAWDARFDAVEWLNADSEWRDETSFALARLAAGYFLRGPGAVAGAFDRPAEALRRFDAIAATRRLVAVAGHDAHARIGSRRGDVYASDWSLPVPSYEAMFRAFAVRAVLDAKLTGKAEEDAAAVVRAIRHGRVYTAIDALASPGRLSFVAQSGRAKAEIGERLIPAGPLVFVVEADAPPDAQLVLLHDGRELASGPPPVLRMELDPAPGAYRAEVRIQGAPGDPPVPWVVTSTIHVGIPSADTPVVPQPTDLVPPLPVPVAPASAVVEHAPASTASISSDSDSIRLDYHLDTVPSGSPYAAVSWPVQIPPGARSIRFTALADRSTRFSVQVRMPRASGGVRWRRSIFADGTEREYDIPFADMRVVGPDSPATPDLSRVNSLLFVADTVNSDPGARGWIRVGKITVQ